MKQFSVISELLAPAFEAVGLSASHAEVDWSDRPAVADLTCNGALRGAKSLGRSPMDVAQDVIAQLPESQFAFSVAAPGYINVVAPASYFYTMVIKPKPENFKKGKTIILDYGGPNIAKPMHVGHLRSLIIGESLKRILRAQSNFVVSDIHWGDWGLQMGLLIAAIEDQNLDLDTLTFEDFDTLYPEASARAKEDAEFRLRAQKATMLLQTKQPQAVAVWDKLVEITKMKLVPQIDELGVAFELYHGESDVGGAVSEMIDTMLDEGVAVESDGAIVIKLNDDLPPLLLRNSEGAALYGATDFATIEERLAYDPDEIIYVVDQRQALHFKQLFAAAALTCPKTVTLHHVGFGTVNGPDGKPLKTRDGGVPKLEDLTEAAYQKALERNPDPKIAKAVSLAAIKFAELSNHRTTNYIFDLDRFMSFEGKTGPYLCYQRVRMLAVLGQNKPQVSTDIETPEFKALAQTLLKFDKAIALAADKHAPSFVAEHAYSVASAFSSFYAEAPIGGSKERMTLTLKAFSQLDQALLLLGIHAPSEM